MKYFLPLVWVSVSTAFAAKPPPVPPPNPVITYSAGSELHVMDADGRNNLLLNKWAGTRTGFDPRWSADRSAIVFFGQPFVNQSRGIYRVDADGTDAQLLVIAQTNPHWSPGDVLGQGEKIAFCYPADATFVDWQTDVGSEAPGDIYVMNPDGSGLARLTDTPDLSETGLAWSPDGTKLAVIVYTHVYPIYNLYIYDLGVVDGKLQVIQVRDIHEQAKQAGIDLPVDLLNLDWANHADVLAVASRKNGMNTPSEIFLLDLNTLQKSTVITSTQVPGGPLLSPAFSPDDSKLVFTCRSGDRTLGGIFSVNIDGTGLKKLAPATSAMGVDWAK